MQHYVYLMEAGYMEDTQILKGRQIDLQHILDVKNAKGATKTLIRKKNNMMM